MILHFYFARRYAVGFVALAAIFFALVAMVDIVDLLRNFADEDVAFSQVLGLTLMKTPGTMNQILPLVMLLSTLWLFLSLARTSELVVTRASGRSALRALVAPVSVALIIGVVAVSTLGPLVAALSNRFAALSESYKSGGTATLSVSTEGLWLRQGGSDGQTVIWAARSNADASVLYDVSFLAYAPDGGPVRRIEAASAALSAGAWSLREAKDWPLASSANPEADATEHEILRIPSTLTLDRIRESLGTSSGVSIWEMQGFIDQLEQAGFSALRHRVWFQSELSRPLFLVSMVLIGAAFTMRHTRFGGTGPSVLAAVLLGFTLYFARNFATILGENGQLIVPIAAWAVPVAANLLALGLLLNTEDG